MSKKKTIPCDRCGARLENIPEKCPHCGEIIRDRMDPFIREGIEKRMGPGWWRRNYPALLFCLFSVPFAASICFAHYSFDNYDLSTVLSVAIFGLVALAYFIIVQNLLKKWSALHLIGHIILFPAMTLLAVYEFPKTGYGYFDWVLIVVFLTVIYCIIATTFVLTLLNRILRPESIIKVRMITLVLLLIIAIVFGVFASDIWFAIQEYKARHTNLAFWAYPSIKKADSDLASRICLEMINNKDDYSARINAIQYSLRFRENLAVEPLIQLLESEPNRDDRLIIVMALGSIKDKRASEPLIKSLENETNLMIRVYIIESLGKIGDNSALEALIHVLESDNDSYLRGIAAETLSKITDVQAGEAIIKAIEKDPDSDVRLRGAIALGNIGDKRAVEPLIDALNNTSNLNEYGEIAEALGNIGDTKAVDSLLKALDNVKDKRNSNRIRDAICKINPQYQSRIAWDAAKRKYYLKPE
jgi:HEAT repeat protein